MDNSERIKELELEVARLKGVIEGMKQPLYGIRTTPVYPTYPPYYYNPPFYTTCTSGTALASTSTGTN